MQLAGQDEHRCLTLHRGRSGSKDEAGYAMAVLLVGMAISAVLMTVAMPVWKQSATREKEEELIFRGQQYVRAIGQFQRRNGPRRLPPVHPGAHRAAFPAKEIHRSRSAAAISSYCPALHRLRAQRPREHQHRWNFTGGSRAAPAATATAGRTGGRGQPDHRRQARLAPWRSRNWATCPAASPASSARARTNRSACYNGRTHYNEWEFRYIPPPQPPQTPGRRRQRSSRATRVSRHRADSGRRSTDVADWTAADRAGPGDGRSPRPPARARLHLRGVAARRNCTECGAAGYQQLAPRRLAAPRGRSEGGDPYVRNIPTRRRERRGARRASHRAFRRRTRDWSAARSSDPGSDRSTATSR